MMPASNTAVPCRSPLVRVDEKYATCHTGPCKWVYLAATAKEAETEARRHRADHRMAVPHHTVTATQDGYVCQCSCGWGVTRSTKTDAAASTAHHLSAHGLVTR